ncbi:MAG: 2-oxo acid dehydrogenase subunit E2, partial [Sedimentisphaerales bacterium]|nr:2-oxo acid dehydrogenase subunit E2 [Sedimentisphaerales bacterium]
GRIAKIVANEGDIIEVKKPVAYLAEEGVDIDAWIASQGVGETAKPAQSVQATDKTSGMVTASGPTINHSPAVLSDTGRVKASPAARKIAGEMGIDLMAIGTGSGPGGRIISADVTNARIVSDVPRSYPTTKMRRAIAKNLQYSKQNVPHFYIRATIDAQALFDSYKQTKEQFKCSLNDFIVLAVARTIKQYPAFRSQYRDTEILEMPNANIGIAVGTDDGLTVPVVLAAETMSLEQLARRTREVVESARKGKLEGVGQGVFTITNLGMFGTEEFSAIINPPESGILAVGAISEGVKVENGAMKPTRLMTMTLSADHRVLDGVVAAQFMQTLGNMLENPQELIG